MDGHVVALLRVAGLVAAVSGAVGFLVWAVDLLDRSDGDGLRLGFWHNPFMQFPPVHEPFLDASMWALLACSTASGAGGLLLLVPHRWGVPLVAWQARASVVVNGAIACLIVATMVAFARNQVAQWHLGGTPAALALRLGAVAVDLALWWLTGRRAVARFCRLREPHAAGGGFDVVPIGTNTPADVGPPAGPDDAVGRNADPA
ncbi:MAG TPA: hypothetical protein VF796_29810 [Humisphaera sp.]